MGDGTIQEVVRKTLGTYWSTVAFQALYARAGDWTPSAADPAPAERPVLDRWVLSELHRLVRDVDAALENFDTQQAGKLLSAYVDDLSNWYVRRSRRRFWKAEPAALATLHTVLDTLTRLMAPLVPFITERVWQDLVRTVNPQAPESVHLSSWPVADEAAIDDRLGEQVELVRRLVELGRATRAESGVKTRQPLEPRSLVGASRLGGASARNCARRSPRSSTSRAPRGARRARRRGGRAAAGTCADQLLSARATSAHWASASRSGLPWWPRRSPPPTRRELAAAAARAGEHGDGAGPWPAAASRSR